MCTFYNDPKILPGEHVIYKVVRLHEFDKVKQMYSPFANTIFKVGNVPDLGFTVCGVSFSYHNVGRTTGFTNKKHMIRELNGCWRRKCYFQYSNSKYIGVKVVIRTDVIKGIYNFIQNVKAGREVVSIEILDV